jgi:PAS domain-containing protein
MHSIGSEDHSFDALLHEVYEAALQPALLRSVMPKVCDWLECESSHLGAWDGRHNSMTFSIMPPEYAHVEKLYAEHYWSVDIRRPVMEAKGMAGLMDACHHYYDDRTAGRSEFYQDLLIPQLDARYGAGGLLVKEDDRIVFIVYNRSAARGEFNDDIMARMRRLTPHLQRTLRLMRSHDELRQATEVGGAALKSLSQGLLLLNRERQIQYANDFAEQLMQEGQACAASFGRWVQGPQSRIRVNELCAQVLRTGVPQSFSERVWLADGREDVYCFTIRAVATENLSKTRLWVHADLVVNITRSRADAPPSIAQFNGWFGLSPAEARLARALAAGSTIEQYVRESAIKASTARTQVRALLEKTQTASLQGLMAVLGRLPSAG